MKLRACFVIVSFLSAVVYTTLAQTAAPNSSSGFDPGAAAHQILGCGAG